MHALRGGWREAHALPPDAFEPDSEFVEQARDDLEVAADGALRHRQVFSQVLRGLECETVLHEAREQRDLS